MLLQFAVEHCLGTEQQFLQDFSILARIAFVATKNFANYPHIYPVRVGVCALKHFYEFSQLLISSNLSAGDKFNIF